MDDALSLWTALNDIKPDEPGCFDRLKQVLVAHGVDWTELLDLLTRGASAVIAEDVAEAQMTSNDAQHQRPQAGAGEASGPPVSAQEPVLGDAWWPMPSGRAGYWRRMGRWRLSVVPALHRPGEAPAWMAEVDGKPLTGPDGSVLRFAHKSDAMTRAAAEARADSPAFAPAESQRPSVLPRSQSRDSGPQPGLAGTHAGVSARAGVGYLGSV